MEMQEIEELLKSTGALKKGCFALPNGEFADEWYFPAKAFQFPPTCRRLSYEIVKHFWDIDPQLIIAARIGAIPFAFEIARQLEARCIWRGNSDEVFYPSLQMHSGDRVVIIDDILTDDIEIYKPIAREILAVDARLIGIASLIDLTTKKTPLNVRQISVCKKNIDTPPDISQAIPIQSRP